MKSTCWDKRATDSIIRSGQKDTEASVRDSCSTCDQTHCQNLSLDTEFHFDTLKTRARGALCACATLLNLLVSLDELFLCKRGKCMTKSFKGEGQGWLHLQDSISLQTTFVLYQPHSILSCFGRDSLMMPTSSIFHCYLSTHPPPHHPIKFLIVQQALTSLFKWLRDTFLNLYVCGHWYGEKVKKVFHWNLKWEK